MPSDKLVIRDLAARCIIGVYPEERRQPQDVLLTIELQADLSAAGRSDRLEDSLDYKAVKQRVLALVEQSQFRLLEALAAAVAGACLESPRVERVTVTLQKPGALRFARCAEVEITRERTR